MTDPFWFPPPEHGCVLHVPLVPLCSASIWKRHFLLLLSTSTVLFNSQCVCVDVVIVSQSVNQPVDPRAGYLSQSFTPKAFTLSNCSSLFPQIFQDPKNDSECLSNITEFLKGCAVFRVEVSWCIYCILTVLYVAALAPQWKQSTKEMCSRQRRRNSGPMWMRSCPVHRYIAIVWWDKSFVMFWKCIVNKISRIWWWFCALQHRYCALCHLWMTLLCPFMYSLSVSLESAWIWVIGIVSLIEALFSAWLS